MFVSDKSSQNGRFMGHPAVAAFLRRQDFSKPSKFFIDEEDRPRNLTPVISTGFDV
jgi:hypothetical protein